MRGPNDKTVFVLGAGFSKAANAPLQSEIMRKALEIARENDIDITKLRDIYRTLYRAEDDESIGRVPLEDIFTVFDLARINNEAIGSYDSTILSLHTKLVSLIIEAFNFIYEPAAAFFFTRALIEGCNTDGADYPCTIIDLNWDLILEQMITAQNHQRVDYCCNYHDLENDQDGILRAEDSYFIKVLKLHGSFNWLVCPNCGRLFIRNGQKIIMPHSWSCCYCSQSCGTINAPKLRHVLITPTLLKDLKNTHLKSIWHNAFIELSEAKRIVFIGYSFPLADFEFRYLLARSVRPDAKIRVVLHPSDDPEPRENYLLTWGRTGESDIKCIQYFLRDAHGIKWVSNAECRMIDGNTFELKRKLNTATVKINENRQEARLKINAYDIGTIKQELTIRQENGELKIYGRNERLINDLPETRYNNFFGGRDIKFDYDGIEGFNTPSKIWDW